MRTRARSPWTCASVATALAFAAPLAACGGGTGETAHRGATPVVQPPADADVFEGQQALFTVFGSGRSLTYQWRRAGVPVAGATDSHYLTPPTTPADAVEYSVEVRSADQDPNVVGARLTVHPPLDLRLKWVGSPVPLRLSYLDAIHPGWLQTWHGAYGAPLLVGDLFVPPTDSDYVGWSTYVGGVPGFETAYTAGALRSLDAGALTGLPERSVVTSLDLQEFQGAGLYAASYVWNTQRGTFPVTWGSSAPEDFPGAVATEASAGRIVTAASHRSGHVVWVSHAWSEASAARYETRVVSTTVQGIAEAAAALATDGYVVTALGAGASSTLGALLVGTRVEGATTPRELVVAPLFPFTRPDDAAPVGYYADGASILLLYQR